MMFDDGVTIMYNTLQPREWGCTLTPSRRGRIFYATEEAVVGSSFLHLEGAALRSAVTANGRRKQEDYEHHVFCNCFHRLVSYRL